MIAPDSGIPSKDGSAFIPDAAVSHFRSLDENGIKNIHEEQFIRQYFTPAHRQSYSKKEYAFFLGYLTHLLTDKIWAREIVYSAKEKQNALFHTNRELFWQTIKKDWYDLDFMYLKSNPSFEAFRIYRESKDIRNTYVDFFSENAFAERRLFILDFYANYILFRPDPYDAYRVRRRGIGKFRGNLHCIFPRVEFFRLLKGIDIGKTVPAHNRNQSFTRNVFNV